jgi:hypothetical protein
MMAVPDKPFIQEFRTLFTRAQGLPATEVTDVAVTTEGEVWAATPMGLARLRGDGWKKVWVKALAGAEVRRLAAGLNGDLWVGGSTGISLLRGGRWRHWWGFDSPTRWIHALAPDAQGGVWAVMSHEGDLGTRDVWHLVRNSWKWWEVSQGRDATAIALDGDGRAYVAHDGILVCLEGDDWRPVDLGGAHVLHVNGAPDGSVWVGTDEEAVVLRGGRMAERIGKEQGLPVRAVREFAFGPEGEVWFLHPVAVSRRNVDGWRYYSPGCWVPGDTAHAIAVAPDGTVWMAGHLGAARIERKTVTLAEKSRLLEPLVPALHLRDGMVYSRTFTDADDPDSPWYWRVTDNDGSHAAEYMAAECFRYAVTRADDAKTNARACLEAVLRLIYVHGRPGFLARSVYRADDAKIVAVAGEWHLSADRKWIWKGDTSSDEVDGDLYGLGIFYDLVADDAERKRIAAAVSELMSGIIDNGYMLKDVDGKHTRWAVWSPVLLLTPEWSAQRKLNSLEILAHVRSAVHITGEHKFRDAYRELVEVHGYAEHLRTQQIATPINAFHKFDDHLAIQAYYPLLQYEDDPALREIYLDSLARFWDYVRPEANPLYTFSCNALLGRAEDLEPAVDVLRGYRMDHVQRGVVNAIRQDIEWQQMGPRKLLTKPLPGPERPTFGWSDNAWESERGALPVRPASPGSVRVPTHYLIAYWLARYHGLIRE